MIPTIYPEYAFLDFLLIAGPYFSNTIGNGRRARENKPSRRPAQPVPIPLNIYPANNGNAAPKLDLINVFPATAEAATKRYDSMI